MSLDGSPKSPANGSQADVDVYLYCLKSLEAEGDAAALALLDPAEIATLQQIKSVTRRVELLHGRAQLRRLLASHAGLSASSIEIVAGPHGKPGAHAVGVPLLPDFNVSHSAQVLAIAIGHGANIGLDIERADPRLTPDLEGIARRQFTQTEYRQIMPQPELERLDCFFRIWTLKEAMLKAVGTGLLLPVNAVDVAGKEDRLLRSIDTGSARILVQASYLRMPRHWHLAVAREGVLGHVRIHRTGSGMWQ